MITSFTMADGEERFFVIKHFNGFRGYFRWNYPNAVVAQQLDDKLGEITESGDWANNYVADHQLTARSNKESI